MRERTLPPSPRRLREARERGQVPRSRWLSGMGVLVCGGLSLPWSAERLAPLRAWTEHLLLVQPEAPGAIAEGLQLFARLALPACAGAVGGALLSGLATSGFDVRFDHLLPRLERFDPFKGLGRLFDLGNLGDAGKGALGWGLLGAVGVAAARSELASLLRAPWAPGAGGLVAALAGLRPWLEGAVALGVLLGLGDFAQAWSSHRRKLMMSREEAVREHRESEGDPRHKAERRAHHRQLSSGGKARGVDRATALVVNPTHVAVALRYAPEDCEAPYLVAKGRGSDALLLRSEAARLGIPVVKDIRLARSLVHYDVGEEIPEELYQAAAAVLRAALDAQGVPA